MALVEADPNLGARIVEDAKEYVLYSWSVQDAINPIAVAAPKAATSGTTRASATSISPHSSSTSRSSPAPEGDRGDQGAGRPALHDRDADGDRVSLAARPAARRDHAGRPLHVLLHQRRRGGERKRDQARSLVHGAAQDRRPLPLLPRSDCGSDLTHRRSAPLGGRAGTARRRADARPLHLPLSGRTPGPVPGVLRRSAPGGDPGLRRPADGRGRDPGDRDGDERRDRPSGRLSAVDSRGVRPARHPADRR